MSRRRPSRTTTLSTTTNRWLRHREATRLADATPGGGAVHAILEHPVAITDPATQRAELDTIQTQYSVVRLHHGLGCVTPMTNTKAACDVQPELRRIRGACLGQRGRRG